MPEEDFNRILSNLENAQAKEDAQIIKKESTTNIKINNAITEQGMTIWTCIIIFVLVKILVRNKTINKFFSAICLVGLYFSSIQYFGLKYKSMLPQVLINIVILMIIFICLIRRSKKRKNER